MCIICISKKGIRQPSASEFKQMWDSNSHGAGYMVARGGAVDIHKGLMNYKDFMRSVKEEKFTDDDVVIYHFRISTQAGVNPYMTHPFPFTADIENTRLLDVRCNLGIVHNGIIRITSNGDKDYSDTALFITQYLPALIRDVDDIHRPDVLRCIEDLAGSKLAFLDGAGNVETVGKFITEKSGLMFSNTTYKPASYTYRDFQRTFSLQELYGLKAHA